MKYMLFAGVAISTMMSGCQIPDEFDDNSALSRGASYDDRYEEFTSLIETLDVETSLTELENIPTAGSASYNGHVGLWVDTEADDPALLGAAEFNANFGTGTLTGSFDQFVTDDDEGFSGTLSLISGEITGGDITGQVVGTLDGIYLGESTSIEATIDIVGGFLGDNPDNLVIVGSGVNSINGAADTEALLIGAASLN